MPFCAPWAYCYIISGAGVVSGTPHPAVWDNLAQRQEIRVLGTIICQSNAFQSEFRIIWLLYYILYTTHLSDGIYWPKTVLKFDGTVPLKFKRTVSQDFYLWACSSYPQVFSIVWHRFQFRGDIRMCENIRGVIDNAESQSAVLSV